tara:strand:+ start:1638 stop:1952 length:315 start_codon:yes stop_codon:yes gene_type:complete
MENLETGTKIYYTGDMANREGFGTITKVGGDRFVSRWYDITMDDGRVFPSLPHTSFSAKFSGGGLTRFVTKQAYQNWRNAESRRAALEQIERWKKEYESRKEQV